MRFSRLIVASRTPGLGKESSKIVVAGGGVWNDMVGSGNAISLENTRCSGVVLKLQCLQYGASSMGGLWWGLVVGQRVQDSKLVDPGNLGWRRMNIGCPLGGECGG